MNVKRGNDKVVAGDYSTYNGLRIGLLQRHTYNEKFIQFTKKNKIDCEIVYYETPTQLSKALVNGEVDALVNSYIRTPEDETTVENFGETPYYFMAKKQNAALIKKIDHAIDKMNVATPNWRSELYNLYYGSQNSNTELSFDEKALLKKMQAEHTTIRAVMSPDKNPYSWYENKKGRGIVADIFAATAKKLGLNYEIIPVSSKKEYDKLIASGAVDICMDMDSYYEDEGKSKYKLTSSYLSTTVSALKQRGSSGKISKIGVLEDNIAVEEIISSTWPNAEVVFIENADDIVSDIIDGKVDCVLLKSYMAQKIARDDIQNRLSVEIVPGATLNLKMGVNAKDSRDFYGIWEKTLAEVSTNKSTEIVQDYLEYVNTPTLIAYLFDHPVYLIILVVALLFIVFMVGLYMESTKMKNRQLKISEQLSEALMEAKEANEARANFFSKMSHDIRTPLNVVLGMTQIAKKYKYNSKKLDEALENITSEGNYLLTMINSILDVNQLEHGHIELIHKPFNPDECMKDSMEILKPLAQKKEQTLKVSSNFQDHVVVGDAGRFSQIMVNIASNAIKYTNVGGNIEVTMESLAHNRYRFTCTDNGIGMEKDYIDHICEEYSRAEDSRTSSTEGAGLGMSVVKGFTELMKGTLQIESELGRGSTFIVEIPFDEPSIRERELLINSKKENELSSDEFKGKKVLLAEDNVLNAEIAIELLQSFGFVVDLAEDGKVAVEKFERSQDKEYFAVFMDMKMPVMNGVEAARRIRSSKRKDRNILIFAMTANTLAKDQKECEEAGMNGYISKPINLKDIKNTLKDYKNHE